jgi:hypothetical protein
VLSEYGSIDSYPPPPIKNASVARKGVAAKKCAIRALVERSLGTPRFWSGQEGVGNKIEGGVYPHGCERKGP